LMAHETLLLALIAILCYLLALLTSYACVRWILSDQLRAELNDQTRYVAIDGIRGYLAFGVYVHHFIMGWLFLYDGRTGPPTHNWENQLGKTSVAIFFMITAFLFWGRAHAKGGMKWKSFFISRVFRIYPLYLVFFFLLCIAVAYKSNWVALEPPMAIAKEIFKWVFFHTPIINSYHGDAFGGVTWTLLYEAWLYLSLPFLVAVFIQKKPAWQKVLALAVAVALFAANKLDIATGAMFLGGIFAVYWRANPKLVAFGRGNTAALVALISLTCVGLFIYDPFNVVAIILLSIFFVAIACGNTLFGLLKMRAARWLGEITYSIYLGHGIVLWVIMQNIAPRMSWFHPTTPWLFASAIVVTPILVLFTTASYVFIERPFIAMGHRLANRRPQRPRTQTQTLLEETRGSTLL
jgi:peptidoglycan/LPS O-acetylase OafA/YrhL